MKTNNSKIGMQQFLTLIRSDYLQRTRSYAFLIVLCSSFAVAYTFIPAPDANYSTIRIAEYIGYYNSAWFGYVTAIMTSIFLSLVGFYLVNDSIKKDIDSRVGQIVCSTQISNFNYLATKVFSNFLVLLTIVAMVLSMSIILFFLYNDGYSFQPFSFIKPYLLITLPAMFFIAVLAVAFDAFLGKYSVILNVVFFFLFISLIGLSSQAVNQFNWDVFGSKIVTHHLVETVNEIRNTKDDMGLSIGYTITAKKESKRFLFDGIHFPTSFVLSRLLWMTCGVLGILFLSPFFHRFNVKEKIQKKTKKLINIKIDNTSHINVVQLSKIQMNYSIIPLIKTEFLLLFRKGRKWMWLINIAGMVCLVALPLKIAHQIILPVLWFLQVSRLSDIVTKDVTNNMSYFSLSTYKPIRRLLTSQVLAGIILMLGLAMPLMVRSVLLGDFIAAVSIFLGCIFIVLFAICLGIYSKGKKLFEVLYFLITYIILNGISYVDYFGGFGQGPAYSVKLFALVITLGILCIAKRKFDLERTV